jgi:exodeoxyribonuclease V beta subunit
MKFFADEDMDVIRNEITRMLWNTVHAPLNGSGLILSELNKKLHEVEFYYPSSLIPTGTAPDISYTDGFIHGFIDMVFEYQDQYYIVDWKSNYIEQGYARGHLEQNIKDMHYDLQIMIYSTAVIRWLKQLIPDYSYDMHFGGVFYLYLRGMNINNPDAGIYFYHPNEQELSDVSSLMHHV